MQLKSRDLGVSLVWVPRDQNEEADALTNGDFHGFDPRLRIRAPVEGMRWLVMDDMLKASEELYSTIEKEKASKKVEAKQARRPPAQRLRARDPW